MFPEVIPQSSTPLQRSVAGFFILAGAWMGAAGSSGILPEYKIPPHFHRISLSLLRDLRELERSGCEKFFCAHPVNGKIKNLNRRPMNKHPEIPPQKKLILLGMHRHWCYYLNIDKRELCRSAGGALGSEH